MITFHLPPPTIVNKLRETLGHTRYYQKFIKGYVEVTAPMENLLKKDVKFQWTKNCQESLDTLKKNMVIVPILVFPYWKKEFHGHVDESSIPLSVVPTQLGKGSIDHPFSFTSRKLSIVENKYTTTKREGSAMVYSLQKF